MAAESLLTGKVVVADRRLHAVHLTAAVAAYDVLQDTARLQLDGQRRLPRGGTTNGVLSRTVARITRLLAGAAVVGTCACGTLPGGDSGVDGGAPADAPDGTDAHTPVPDAGGGACALVPGESNGAACLPDRTCAAPAICLDYEFPGALCATSCDPHAESSDSVCDEGCERCVDHGLIGNLRFRINSLVPGVEGICRPRCEPTATDTGGCRADYACDTFTRTCLESCTQSPSDCLWRMRDGELVNDPDPGIGCNRATGRCYVEGNDDATAGDACEDDRDCQDDGECVGGAFYPRGYCTRMFCSENLPCAAGDVCARAVDGIDRLCLASCRVGSELDAADPDAAIVGTAGANPDCGHGQRCVWDGVHEASDAENGGCWPGNYSAETTYDVGTACVTDADCYSPFGYGVCLFGTLGGLVPSGICAITGCAGGEGGMPVGLSGGRLAPVVLPTVWQDAVCRTSAGDACFVQYDDDDVQRTICLHTCESADDCLPGYACVDADDEGSRVCFALCSEDTDCRAGARCFEEFGDPCPPDSSFGCFCRDAGGAPDAGPLPDDGGV
jgi:hypothetical protein